MDLKVELLRALEENARYSLPVLSKMLQVDESTVEQMIKELEADNVILKYTSLVDWSKVEKQEDKVFALIDVKVQPKRGVGFDEIAERIYRYHEVESVYLMSGAYDLSVMVEGKSMHEIAMFVSEKLSTLDSVLSTATHFMLKKYKHDGTVFGKEKQDKRIVVTP